MGNKAFIDAIKDFLPINEPFTREVVRNFFAKRGEDLTEVNLKVRVNRLKSQGLIVNIGRGWYKLNDKSLFTPEITPGLKKFAAKLKKDFPFLNYSVWHSRWLGPFTELEICDNIIIIEAEAGAEEDVFGFVKQRLTFKAFLNPNENEWLNHRSEHAENIIIKTMVSESPKENYHGIKIARLEKIMVDIYCDKLWQIIFSSQLKNIYKEACKNYVINFSTMLSYAARRGKRKEIQYFLKSLEVLDLLTMKMIGK